MVFFVVPVRRTLCKVSICSRLFFLSFCANTFRPFNFLGGQIHFTRTTYYFSFSFSFSFAAATAVRGLYRDRYSRSRCQTPAWMGSAVLDHSALQQAGTRDKVDEGVVAVAEEKGQTVAGSPGTGTLVDDTVQYRDKHRVGGALQEVAHIDNQRVGQGRRSDPVAVGIEDFEGGRAYRRRGRQSQTGSQR
jgi:hypothetical protein